MTFSRNSNNYLSIYIYISRDKLGYALSLKWVKSLVLVLFTVYLVVRKTIILINQLNNNKNKNPK